MDFSAFISQPLLIGLSALVFIQLLFYFVFFLKSLTAKSRDGQPQPVSIIIIARSELENLQRFLPMIFAQDHTEFEVIVVNNASWDESLEYLTALKETEPRLKVVNIPDDDRFRSGKKLAITLGIKAAKYDNLLLTDADCYPATNNWVSIMSSKFEKGNLVLGISLYEKRPGFLNSYINFETMYTALQYTGLALAGKPYMGVGRNLGYTKQLFYSVKGFAAHHYVEAGDDDLFVRDVSETAKIKVSLNPESYTISLPKLTWADWIRQKTRHINTGKHYNPITKLLLGALHASALGAIMLTILSVFTSFWSIALILYGVMLLSFWIIAGIFAFRLKEKRIILLIPVFQFIFPFYIIFIGLRTFVIRNIPW